LFKFAVDHKGIYGSDYAAGKAASHEIKGATIYYNLGIEELQIPFMALLDHRGYRLMAISLVPITHDTIVSGSNDGGLTIHADDKKLQKILAETADRLKLSPHIAGKVSPKMIYTVADLEVHKGSDSNYYLIDFARVMPPQMPTKPSRREHLYKLFRPEFVKAYPKRLCPDALSGFIANDPKRALHNARILHATDYLYKVVVPRVAAELDARATKISERELLFNRLAEYLHSWGINLRLMGMLRSKVQDPFVRTLLLVEMCSRVIKDLLNRNMRKIAANLKLPLEAPYRKSLIKELNLLFQWRRFRSIEEWKSNIKKGVLKKFGKFALTEAEKGDDFKIAHFLAKEPARELRDFSVASGGQHMSNYLYLLFYRLQDHLGFVLRPDFILDLEARKPFQQFDLVELGEKVKHINVIGMAEALLYRRAAAKASGQNKVQLLRRAIAKFEDVLSAAPNELEGSCYLADSIKQLALAIYDMEVKVELMRKANMYFKRALEINPNDPQVLYRYGLFFQECGDHNRAAEYYLRAVEAFPSFHFGLRAYGSVLGYYDELSLAEDFYARARKCLLVDL
jgi:tetratricopeptide (TPR) repeat protein